MNPARRAPQQLKYVAYLYLFIGFFSMAVMIGGMTPAMANVNLMAEASLGIAAVPIGWGLLRLRREAYAWAIIVCCVYLVISPLTLIRFIMAPVRFAPHLTLKHPALTVGMALGALIWALSMGIAVWQFEVLHSAAVQRAFARDVGEREAP